MTILKYFGTHFGDLGHYLWENIEESVGRIKFVAKSGFVLCHRVLIFSHFPALVELFCDHCDLKHEDSIVIAPEVDIDQLITAVEIFYKSGVTEPLNAIFLELFADGDTMKHNPTEDALENILEMPFEKNTCRVLDVVKPVFVFEKFLDGVVENSEYLENAIEPSNIETTLEENEYREIDVDDRTKVSKKGKRSKKHENVRFLSTDFVSRPLPDGKFVYLCNKCGKGCSNMSGAARHSFFCSAGSDKSKNVNNHICDTCGKIFKTNKMLNAHIIIHNVHIETHTENNKVKRNSCDTCGKIFKKRKWLYTHIKKHTETRQIKRKICDTCGKTFKTMKWLNVHIRKHSETEQIKEEVDMSPLDLSGGDKAIGTAGDAVMGKNQSEQAYVMMEIQDQQKGLPIDFIARHLGNGKLVYQCRKCFKSCTNISGASRHSVFCKKETYREGTSNPVPCELCTKVCLTAKGLTEHKKKVHTVDSVPKLL